MTTGLEHLPPGSHSCGGDDSEAHDPDPNAEHWLQARGTMVARQIAGRGLNDPRVLAALGKVPRHLFVPAAERAAAYADRPLAIGHGQTISQPYIVALMTEALQLLPTDSVLEVGTGSGYQAAVLAELARDVYSIEILPELAQHARGILAAAGYERIHLAVGDGSVGWPAAAPFDAIVATAAPEQVPEALLDQLRDGGRLVVPVGPKDAQELVRFVRRPGGWLRQLLAPVRFVPMTGAALHPEAEA